MKTHFSEGPNSQPVSVVMQRTAVPDNRWIQARWSALGITAAKQPSETVQEIPIGGDEKEARYMWSGLSLHLFKDQAESYYHNLVMESPRLFLVCRYTDEQRPEPFLVTASCDEANAYVETDEVAYSVPLSVEFYQWIEGFVLEHYIPEKRYKRKRKNWKDGE